MTKQFLHRGKRGLALAAIGLVGLSQVVLAEVTPGHPLRLLPVGSTLELKKDVDYVPNQKHACFVAGQITDCDKIQAATASCYLTLKETSPRGRRLKASATPIKVTKVTSSTTWATLEVQSKTVESITCTFAADRVGKIETAQALLGEYLKITIAPPDEINPRLIEANEENDYAADSPVTDNHFLYQLPVTSKFELKKDVEFIPNQMSACFQSGRIVDCASVERPVHSGGWLPHCSLALKDSSEKSRRLKAGGAALSVLKVLLAGTTGSQVTRLMVDSKTVLSIQCADGKNGDKLSTIGAAKLHFADYGRLTIAPPQDIDPIF